MVFNTQKKWVLNILRKLCNLLCHKSKRTMILKTTFYNPSIINTETLVNYLNSISGKPLTITCIRQNLFKTKWSSRINVLMNRCHIKAAALYLTHLITEEKSLEFSESIKTTIADIIPYVKELDRNEDCSFILANTNTLPSSQHYKHARWIFYKNRLPDNSNRRYDLDVLVLYALRLSLEKRILGFLGIDYLLSNGRPVGLSKIILIATKLKNVKFDPQINWNEIMMVNNWLNHYMHRRMRPYPWGIHQVFEVLNPFLLSGRISDGDTVYASIYASTFVDDENKLNAEIQDSIKTLIHKSEIQWSYDRDILKAKK